jgi:hypothetical protein
MRTLLFRTEPVLLVGPYTNSTVVCLKDLDGIWPVTVYVENMDLKAALTMRTGGTDAGYVTHGSKNGCLKFEAVTAGAGGNANTIEITAAPDQAFSIVNLVYDGWKINLKCDHSGKPIQLASEVMIAIERASGDGVAFRAAVSTSLAPGSDGSATMELATGSTTHVIAALTALAGGADASDAGTATVEHAPTIDGPWDKSTAASAAFSDLELNTVAAFEIGAVRGLRITIERGVEDTRIVCSAIAARKV